MKKTYKYDGFDVKKDLETNAEVPDWIKKAKKKYYARITYRMRRDNISREEAEKNLGEELDNKMQGEND